MNQTSCAKVLFTFEHSFLPPVFILVFIIGLVANGWGLKSLLHKWEKLGDINVFVLNLGVADILYLLTLPFLMVYYFMKSKWIFGDVFCKITRFCFNLNLYGSIGFLTCISVYRYLAIVHPMRVRGKIAFTHSVIISMTVWLLVSVQSLPDVFYTKTFGNKPGKCYDTTHKNDVENYLIYSVGWTFTGFCIPLLIILGCYGHVIVLLCTTNTIDKNLNLWVRVLTKQGKCHKWNNGVYIAHQISRGLICLNSALNPLVYLHGNEDIVVQFRQLLQGARQMFRHLFLSNTSSEHTTQTAVDVEQLRMFNTK
ncbi:P2Y purinoceptor 1-like [Anabas testudineus]|uniref:P2Y purinoceptor 1-like n=1 Tax=Anabas testudineus TaxID=64144 RepID=UPI000E45A15F|nr:P2Y purinoceptor 1-like [Anabas testudineus]